LPFGRSSALKVQLSLGEGGLRLLFVVPRQSPDRVGVGRWPRGRGWTG
jgi:hypothetical protein